jgi:opacity protein-like surface antigen
VWGPLRGRKGKWRFFWTFPKGVPVKAITILILLALVHTPALAQDDGNSASGFGKRDGRGAILFLVNELSIGSFGGGIGGKYWLSDLWAMNASVDLGHTRSDTDEEGSTDDFSSTSVGLSTAIERHLVRARLSPYVGAGIGYTYTYRKTSRADDRFSRESRTKAHQASGALTLGVEYWLSSNFSLAGQYRLSFYYVRQKDTSDSSFSDPEERTTDQWNAGLGATSLVLAVYF